MEWKAALRLHECLTEASLSVVLAHVGCYVEASRDPAPTRSRLEEVLRIGNLDAS
jgi:hypothetical protein